MLSILQCNRAGPKRRAAAQLPEFYRFLETNHPRLLDFPENVDGASELAKILRGHLST
jgi:hypothetical protein